MDFSLAAYLRGLVSIFSQGLYLTYVQKLGIEKQLTALELLYVNSINCIPLFLLYILLSWEFVDAVNFLRDCTFEFILVFLLVISMGCVLNYSLFLCTTLNSALTTSIVGVIKSVVTTVIGMFTFGGIQPTVLIITGISINTLGGMGYTYLKYKEKQEATDLPKWFYFFKGFSGGTRSLVSEIVRNYHIISKTLYGYIVRFFFKLVRVWAENVFLCLTLYWYSNHLWGL